MDRTSGQPQDNLSLLRSNSLNFQPQGTVQFLHEGNTEEENNVSVVSKRNCHESAGKWGGGKLWDGRYSTRPHLFLQADFWTDI